MKSKWYISGVVVLSLSTCLLSDVADASAAPRMDLKVVSADEVRIPENRVIYEVFVRNFSPEGNLKGVEAQIPRLKELGVDVVWLMPIYKLGETGKWGTYSSPYAVKNYKQIDPDNGSEQDLRDLVKTIHDNGMEIWFDWVANHTSMDNVWVDSNPEFYSRTEDGEFVHPFGGAWRDVYELSRDNEAMHDAMIDAMQYWVDNFDIDGFRCDYASGPSPELWRKASERVLKNGKRVAWLAEDSSLPSLVQNGYFDYNYCWDFQEKILKHFAQGQLDLAALRDACELLANHGLTAGEAKAPDDQLTDPYRGRSRMVYIENHDIVQDQGGSGDIVYGKYLRPLTVLEFTVYGMPLIYNGQEIQHKTGGRVSLAEKTPIDWSHPDELMAMLIKNLVRLKHSQPALRTGSEGGMLVNIPTNADDEVYAYKRVAEGNEIIVLLNFGEKKREVKFKAGVPAGKYVDALTGRQYKISETSRITLNPLDGVVLVKNWNYL